MQTFHYRRASGVTTITRHIGGFTLIELLITIAIMAILATLAYASYDSFVVRSRRAAAAACLQERAQFMERFFTQNSSYLNGGANPTLPILESPRDGATKYYDISFQGTNTVSTFTLRAVPKGVMAGDACGTLTLTQAGVKGVVGASRSVAECW